MISVAIAALPEEEKKLEGCLASVKGLAGEVVITKIGQDVPFTPFVESIRNKMADKCRGDWILILDPDERISPSLAQELKRVAAEGRYNAVNIPRKNVFFGHWIAHTNWWPDRLVRFFKKGRVVWERKVHAYPKVSGRQLDLPAQEQFAIIHYGYDSIREFIERQNRYSDIEAENRFQAGERFSWPRFVWWPVREFLVRFVRHQGFLDGFYGFALTYLMMLYKLSVLIKIWEREK